MTSSDSPEPSESGPEVWGQYEATWKPAGIVIGWTGDLALQVEGGIPGVTLPIGWIDEERHIVIKVLFIPAPFVPMLRNTLSRLSDPEFIDALNNLDHEETGEN